MFVLKKGMPVRDYSWLFIYYAISMSEAGGLAGI